MDETTEQTEQKTIPFNNLYLISGLVHGLNKSWMYMFTMLLLVFGYLLFQSAAVYPLAEVLSQHGISIKDISENPNLLFDANALHMDRNVVLLIEFGMFVFGFIGFYLGLRYIHQKTITSVLTGYEKFRFKRFWFAFATWGLMVGVSVLAEYFLNPGNLELQSTPLNGESGFHFNTTGFIISIVIMLVMMPVQTGLEEVIFRGYLVQGLSQVFKNGFIPLIITSLLFGMAHMSNPEVRAYGWPIMLTYFCSFALFMGALTLLDEGLELAFGIHFANNIMSSILVSSPNSVIKTYSIFEAKHEDPYAEIWSWLVMAAITFLIFWLKYRWKNFSLILK
ncbi:hypothetical protein CNR22_16735 [Sphingobacteriaceae bacterium]|nr:hypothetical protein CNR22_16735 [Sphingobacteriaceae bacterium]